MKNSLEIHDMMNHSSWINFLFFSFYFIQVSCPSIIQDPSLAESSSERWNDCLAQEEFWQPSTTTFNKCWGSSTTGKVTKNIYFSIYKFCMLRLNKKMEKLSLILLVKLWQQLLQDWQVSVSLMEQRAKLDNWWLQLVARIICVEWIQLGILGYRMDPFWHPWL